VAPLTPRPTVLLVPDCGPGVGIGHLERALALAETMRPLASLAMALPPDPVVEKRVQGRDLAPLVLPDSVNERAGRAASEQAFAAVILDGYGFDLAVQAELRRRAKLVLVDDLSQACDVDLHVNPAPGGETLPRPAGAADAVAGPRFAIMSPAYAEARRRHAALAAVGPPRVVVATGATDLLGLRATLLGVLEPWAGEVEVDVVVGSDSEPGVIPGWARSHQDLPDLAGLLAGAALYVGAAGTTAVQAAAVGVAQVICPVAGNQVAQAEALRHAGAAAVAEPGAEAAIGAAVNALLEDPARRAAMGAAGARLVDGQGAARVADLVARLAGVGAAA